MAIRQRRLPPERTPLQEGQHAFRGCLWALLGMAVCGGLFAVLWWWGGMVGRILIYSAGFGFAGLLAPLFTDPPARSHQQERFLFYFGLFLAMCGVIFGGWAGYANDRVPWWVTPVACFAFVVAGGWLSHRCWRWRSNAYHR